MFVVDDIVEKKVVEPMEILSMECPDVVKAFQDMSKVIMEKPNPDYKIKQLILIGICSAMKDLGGVRYHSGEALKAGATEQEIVESILLALPAAGVGSVLASLPVALEVIKKVR